MERNDTIFNFFLNTCSKYADNVAFIEIKKYRRKITTYKSIEEKVKQVNEYFKSINLVKGDKIIICSQNNPLWVSIFFACAQRGIILIPLDLNSSPVFIKKIILLTEAKYIFFSKDLPQSIIDFSIPKIYTEDIKLDFKNFSKEKSVVTIAPEDILEIVFSSGSTGEPKGIILTNKNVCSNLYALSTVTPLSSEHKFLSIVPLSHMLEQTTGLLSPMLWGAKIIYLYTIKPKNILETFINEKITSVVCVPIFLQILKKGVLQKQKEILKNLREFFVGGAPLDKDQEKFWNDIGVFVLQGYGMTETSPLISASSHKVHKPCSVGKPLPGETVILGEDGEILIKGPNVSPGYYNDPETTKNNFENGFMKSGDIGEFDKEGFLYIKGRKKNTIVSSSGMKIYPEDVEAILRENHEIQDAVVCGIEKEKGITIVAMIIPSKADIDIRKLIEKSNEKLASHQKIQGILIWPNKDFPRTSTKKIIRNEIYNYIKNDTINIENQEHKISATPIDPLIRILTEITNASVDKITPQSNLVTDIKLDSIMRLELVSMIEEEFNIEIEESSINHHSTVFDLQKIIENTTHNQKEISIPKWPRYKIIVYLRMLLQYFIFLLLKTFQSLKLNTNKNFNYTKPVIFIANHQSHLDTPNILKALPLSLRMKTSVAAAKDYFLDKKTKAFFSYLVFNTFPLDRKGNIRESLRIMGKLLDNGQSILIFPEGTRTPNGDIQQFKNGIGVIAHEMEVPIIPIKISGNFEILPKGKNLPKFGKTSIIFGDPITFPVSSSYIETTEKLMETVKSL